MSLVIQLTAISGDFFKVGIILFAISALLMGLVAGLKKLFVKNKKRFFLYILVTLLLFAATALLSNEKVLNDIPLSSFIGFQIIFLILGSLHVFLIRKYFSDLNKGPSSFWSEFAYTVVIILIGLISFLFVVDIYKPEYKYIFAASAICFLIPLLVVKLYEFAVSIPVPIYKKWFYPLDKNIKDPKDDELVNPLVISFEFNKGEKSNELSNFRLKAPEKMEFGKLFYFFINDYNDRHPGNEIEFLDRKNAPTGWIFYTKPNWMGVQRHIDFTRTIQGNNIKENDVIICARA